MKKILFTFLTLALVISLIGISSAVVSQTYQVREAIIEPNGQITLTNNPVTNFNVEGYVCTSADCSNISTAAFANQPLSSGSNSQITLQYPTSLQGSGYAVYFYKDNYITYEIKSTYSGSGTAPTQTIYLTQVRSCNVPIKSIQVSNTTSQVLVNVTVQSPITEGGPLPLVPQSLNEFYSVDVKVNLSSSGAHNSDLSETEMIRFSNSTIYQFTLPVHNGTYSLDVQASAQDEICLTSPITQQSTNFTINLPSNQTNQTETNLSLDIENPENNFVYNTQLILVNISSQDAESVWFNINSGTNITYTSPVEIQFSEGSYTLRAFAQDANGNIISDVVNFIVSIPTNQTNQTDTTPPASISNLQLVERTNTSLKWTWNNPQNDFGFAIVSIDGVNVINTTSNTYTALNLAPNSTHTISIRTSDLNGNVNQTAISNTATTLATLQDDDDGGNDDDDDHDRRTRFINDSIFIQPTQQVPEYILDEYFANLNDTTILTPIREDSEIFIWSNIIIGILALLILLLIILIIITLVR